MAPVIAVIALVAKPLMALFKVLSDLAVVAEGLTFLKKLFSRKRAG
jgi:hypothetical protein